MEKDRSSIVGFALAGLALGAAAWYLFGTKEGRENFDRAVEGIGEVSSKLQSQAKKGVEYASEKLHDGMEQASHFAETTKEKARDLVGKAEESFSSASKEAKEKGQALAGDAKDLADKAAKGARDLADDAKAKINKATS